MSEKLLRFVCLFFVAIGGNIREIECAGSRNIYLDDVCDTLLDMGNSGLESIRMEITRKPAYYNNMDCVVHLRAPRDKQFEIKVLQNYIVSSPGCQNDFFQLFDGPDMTSRTLAGLDSKVCASSVVRPHYTSATRDLVLRFKSDKVEGSDGFIILFTAFRTDANGQCLDSEFQCSASKRCISETLVCDYNEDCTDASDDCSRSTASVIGITVGCIAGVLLVIAVIACFCCYKRSKSRAGFTRQLTQSSSEDYVTSVDDVDISGSVYQKAPSTHGQFYRPSSVYSIKSEPYVITAPGRPKSAHVWITAPPDASRASVYSNPNF